MLTLFKHILAFSFIALFLSACSTLNKNECITANWKTIGYEDGARGYKASRIGQHRSACAEFGIRPDLNAYNAGRADGLPHYCTPTTAYKKGLSGYHYNGVCAGYNERDFVDALNYGLTIYKANNRLRNLKNKYADEEEYITRLERKLHKKEDRLVSGKLSKIKALKLCSSSSNNSFVGKGIRASSLAPEIGRAHV